MRDVTIQDILNARNQARPPEAGMLQTLFDNLFPDPEQGMPIPPLMTGQLGPTGPYGIMSMKDRLSALMENPEYFRVPLRSRLAMLKGIPVGEVSPSVGRNVGRLREMVGRARGTTLPGGEPRGSTRPPSDVIKNQGWISELLHGVLNR